MTLLITGAFNWTDEYISVLSKRVNVIYIDREDSTVPIEAYQADAIICNWLFVYNPIERFEKLKYIQLLSAGYDRIDLDYVHKNNIVVNNASGVYSIPMAEYSVVGVLTIMKHMNAFCEKQRQHIWMKDRELIELFGKRVCVFGVGSVGTEVGKRFAAFTDEIYGIDIDCSKRKPFKEIFSITDMDEQLSKSDVVVLTLPLNDITKNMFGKQQFDKMKEGAIFVNISRGELVIENDLLAALDNKLLGAVIDVFEKEPLDRNNPLWDKANVIITPHNSFVSDKVEQRMWGKIRDNITFFLNSYEGLREKS